MVKRKNDRGLSRKVKYRIFIALALKFNLYNKLTFKLIKLPKIEDDIFKIGMFIKKGATCIDIGANVGMYSVICSKYAGQNGKVLAFEPSTQTYRALYNVINGKIMSLSNVQLFNMALGDKDANVDLIFSYENNGRIMDPLTRIGNSQGNIKMTTLDRIITSLNIERVDFIKIDVEGFEFNVLKGAVNVISKFHPLILMEVDNQWLERYSSSSKNICNFLEQFAYKPFVLKDNRFKIIEDNVQGNIYFRWIG